DRFDPGGGGMPEVGLAGAPIWYKEAALNEPLRSALNGRNGCAGCLGEPSVGVVNLLAAFLVLVDQRPDDLLRQRQVLAREQHLLDREEAARPFNLTAGALFGYVRTTHLLD